MIHLYGDRNGVSTIHSVLFCVFFSLLLAFFGTLTSYLGEMIPIVTDCLIEGHSVELP